MQKKHTFRFENKKEPVLVRGILEFASLPAKSTLKEYKEKCNAILNFSYKK